MNHTGHYESSELVKDKKMSKIDEKLQHFANDIMSDVGEERRQLLEALDKELREEYDAKENEYLGRAYEIIQDALVKIEQKKNESLSRIVMGNRSKLFEKRAEILEDIYKKAEDRLRAFKKTEAYKSHLLKRVEEAKSLLGEGELWVKLDYSDRELAGFIEKETGCLVEVESKKVVLIGGCIVHNRTNNTIVDYAFSRKLEDAKEGFVHQCRLEID